MTSLLRASAFALLSLALHGLASAQASDFPSKPVTIVTPFAAGSGPDAVLRLVSEKLGKAWNQRVAIDNKPGGGGFIAIEAARRAAPDGYTLLQLDSEHLAALPYLYKARNFKTLEAFDMVGTLFRTPFMIAVASDSPWKSMGELVAAAKAGPGKVTYGSWGVGSPGHLGGGLLESLTATSMQHVPIARFPSSTRRSARATSLGPTPRFRRARGLIAPARFATSPLPPRSGSPSFPMCRPSPRRAGRKG
jgi:tripartite-type tricarboxylate transporter receptor subunit TctC